MWTARRICSGCWHGKPGGETIQDKRGHSQARQTVQPINAGDGRCQAGHQDCRGGNHIIAGIGGGGNEGFRPDKGTDLAVEEGNPHLEQDGCHQNHTGEQTELHRIGVNQFGHTLFEQLNADDQNHHRHGQTGQVFVPGMAERMFVVRRAGPQAKAHQTDHAGAGIGQVVHAIGGNGHAAEQGAHGKLARKQ